MNSKIKNIIFDLGGVLLDIDYQLTIDAFEEIGVHNFKEMYSKAQQTDVFNLLETGKIDEIQFCESIRTITKLDLRNQQIIDAWNAMLLNLPNERIVFLEKIKSKYRTFLLSNTNEIHFRAFTKIIRNENSLPNLNGLFEAVHYSHDLKMRKPHPETFLLVCKLNNLKPEETLFMDDSPQHVEGAIKAGLKAVYLDVNTENVINKLGYLLD